MKKDKLTIEQVKNVFLNIPYGTELNRTQIVEMVTNLYGKMEVIPSDYCYNRVNKDPASVEHPRLFEMVGNGVYVCLGEDYPYNKPMYTQPTGTKNEIVVGIWENGVFTPNENWEKCGLKEPTFKNVKK